jgi:uncharacterized RDD family membrane protein YckC
MSAYMSYSAPARPYAQPAQIQTVGIIPRFIAHIIDQIILGTVGAAIGLFFGLLMGQGADRDMAGVAILGMSVVISVIYYLGFWSMGGQTPGKMLLGLVIVQDDGKPLTFVGALLRFFGYFVSNLVLSLGFAAIAFDATHRGWHDKIASTVVVKSRDLATAEGPPLFYGAPSGNEKILVIVYYALSCIVPVVLALLVTAMLGSSMAP